MLDTLPRLTLVVGKGGVGKTTAAASLAVRAAERRSRTLLLSTDPAGTLSQALGADLGHDPAAVRGVSGSLDALQIAAAVERQRFLAQWRETIIAIVDRGTYLDLDDISSLVDAALPGADEIFAVLRLGTLAQTAAYDRIIVDTAPTGHTLRLLDLPATFAALIDLLDAMQSKHRFMVRALTRAYRQDAADDFIAEMRARVEHVSEMLRDPSTSAALLVYRPEPVVIAESDRFVAELRRMGIRLAAVIANARPPRAVLRLSGSDAPAFDVPLLGARADGVDGLREWTAALERAPSDRSAHRGARRPSDRERAQRPAGNGARRRRGAPEPLALLARSLTIVGGKGGVGKTTTACALALAAAEESAPVLLVSTDPAPSISDALGVAIGDRETAVANAPGLVARQMNAAAAFEEFRDVYQRRVDDLFDAFVRRGVSASHDRTIVRNLLSLAPPGIDEVYALATLGETLEDGRFGRVIVDPAPTGHLLRLLEMPPLALEWSHQLMRLMLKYRDVGALGDAAEQLLAFARRTRHVDQLLRNPDEATVVIVALDEPLVRGETERLVRSVRAHGIDVRGIVWNRSAPSTPPPLPALPPAAQFVAPVTNPAPVGSGALRAWSRRWRTCSEGQ